MVAIAINMKSIYKNVYSIHINLIILCRNCTQFSLTSENISEVFGKSKQSIYLFSVRYETFY